MLKQRIGEYGPDSGGRVKGVTLIKPIVFGNQVSPNIGVRRGLSKWVEDGSKPPALLAGHP
jgi:hypothetical protein